MLEINELFRAKKPLEEIDAAYESIQVKWRDKSLDEMVPAANEWMTTQLSEMFQHLHDVDSGDLPIPATLPRRPKGLLTAAEQTSIGPSTHTNPLMTLDFQMQQLFQDNKADALRDLRLVLTKRHGFSLWVGPTQAPTPSHKAGIYLKGVAQAGTVVVRAPNEAPSERGGRGWGGGEKEEATTDFTPWTSNCVWGGCARVAGHLPGRSV